MEPIPPPCDGEIWEGCEEDGWWEECCGDEEGSRGGDIMLRMRWREVQPRSASP